MGSFSIFHWLVVILVLLLLFGPKRFADAAKGLGQALRGFKEELGKGEQDPQAGPDGASKRLPPAESSGTEADAKRDV
jgi:sec-independent protein translocase protein TatA